MYQPCLEEVGTENDKTDEPDDIAIEAGRRMPISP